MSDPAYLVKSNADWLLILPMGMTALRFFGWGAGISFPVMQVWIWKNNTFSGNIYKSLDN